MTCALVVVFEPDNIVLAQIAPRLDFNDFQWDFAGIGQAMNLTERDIGRLVFTQDHDFVATGDFCRALNDDPVLGAMVVFL